MALMPDDGLAHGALRQEAIFDATLSAGLTSATHAGRQVSVSKGLGPLVGWFGGAKPLQFSRRALLAATLAAPAARAATTAQWFRTSDGVRLRYLEAGSGRTVVFVPGWCMPANIFQPQIDALSRRWRVVSLDPRGQGESEVPRGGYDPTRRGEDIRDLLAHLGGGRVVLAGWSLGVLDALSYADMAGDGRLAGLVLIDNSVGEGRAPPPRSVPSRFFQNLRQRRDATVRGFVASMYKTPQGAAYLDAIARQAQRMPVEASIRLLSYPRPREFWKQSLYAVRRPVYYAVTPRLRGQADLVAQHHPQPMVEVFDGAGHALFVDEAARFNASLEEFLSRRAAWS
jgi:microsomal epoxide hydrolase